MSKLKIPMDGGTTRIVEGARFTHYVGPYRFWFFISNEFDGAISHVDSCLKVGSITCDDIAACLGDRKAAAKLMIDHLIKTHGEDRVILKLNEAAKNAEAMAAIKVRTAKQSKEKQPDLKQIEGEA